METNNKKKKITVYINGELFKKNIVGINLLDWPEGYPYKALLETEGIPFSAVCHVKDSEASQYYLDILSKSVTQEIKDDEEIYHIETFIDEKREYESLLHIEGNLDVKVYANNNEEAVEKVEEKAAETYEKIVSDFPGIDLEIEHSFIVTRE